MSKKDASLIPPGIYCYTYIIDKSGKSTQYTCPYWSIREDHDSQCNGYCSYLEIGDWEDGEFGLLWDQIKLCF